MKIDTTKLDGLKTYWAGLQSRERLFLKGLGVFLGVVFLLYGILFPVSQYADDSVEDYRAGQDLLNWMQAREGAARALAAKPQRQVQEGSLLTIASDLAKRERIKFKRFEPQEGDGLRIWMEEIPFEQVLKWLHGLSEQYGVQVQDINIDRRGEGVVNVRVLLSQ